MQVKPSIESLPLNKAKPQAKAASPSKSESQDSFEAQESGDGFFDRMKGMAKRAIDGFSRPKLPLYKESEGEHQVSIERLNFRDESRGRDVPLVVYHPSNKEDLDKSPVVVFSHGLAGNEYTYRYFGKHLASHGYTVLQPTHVGSNTSSFVKRPGLNIFSQKELIDRGKDVSFALDLLQDGKLSKEISEKVDLENVALAGHSFGALTAQAMAGVVVKDHEGKEVPIQDDRFDAFIGMSPYGDSLPTHLLGMDPSTFDRIEKPLLTLSGDIDRLFTGTKGAKVHLDTFHGASSEHKYHVVIDKTLHAAFAQMYGLIGVTAALTNSTSMAFLDANLKGDKKAHDYLVDDLAKVAHSHKSVALVGPHLKS